MFLVTKVLVGEAEVILGHPSRYADENDKWAILAVRHGDVIRGEPLAWPYFDLWEGASNTGPELVEEDWPQLWDIALDFRS